MSDVRTQDRRSNVYEQVCLIIDSRRQEDETADEFKTRAAQVINGFSAEEYEQLPSLVHMWFSDTSEVMASNLTRKRPSPLPKMPGLDTTLRRFDISKPLPKKIVGRRRVHGEDAVTRVMTVLSKMRDPEGAKVEEVRDRVYERYQVQYNDSTIKSAANAFYIAREVLGLNQQHQAAAE
jgi:hypothetical protein